LILNNIFSLFGANDHEEGKNETQAEGNLLFENYNMDP